MEPAEVGAGYMTEMGCEVSSDWIADGGPDPAPMVMPVSEAAEAGGVTLAASAP